MPKIKSPETFVPNQVLAASALQNHTDGAYPLPGFISEQISIDAIASGDSIVILDASTNELRKALISDITNSNFPVKTSSIIGVSGSDIVITPVTGKRVIVNSAITANAIDIVGNIYAGGNMTIAGSTTLNAVTINGAISGPLTVTGSITASTAPTTGGHLANKTYVDGTVSKFANGYLTLPNGLMMQWGSTVGLGGLSSATVTFPTPFTTSCFGVYITVNDFPAGGSAQSHDMVTSVTKNSFVLKNNSNGASGFYWFAIGY